MGQWRNAAMARVCGPARANGVTGMRALCDGAIVEPMASDPGKRLQAEVPCDALDRFGIADLASRPFHELSGGQRQLVIFGRALV